MNTDFQSILLITAIIATFIILTFGMYRRFALQPIHLAYKHGRTQLIIIFIIGLLTGAVGSIFKNPFTNEDLWILAKDAILIMLSLHLIILLANGLITDIYKKFMPTTLLHATTTITGLVAIIASTLIAQGNLNLIRLGASVGSISFIALTAAFIALLMTGIIIRIIKRTQ